MIIKYLKYKPYLIILYFISFVAISTLSDALFDEGIKIWAHILEVMSYGLLIFAFPIFKPGSWIAFVCALIAWNAIGCDWLYNLYRGLPWDYIGSTSLWDRFFSKYPYEGLLFVKALCLIVAVHLPFKYCK